MEKNRIYSTIKQRQQSETVEQQTPTTKDNQTKLTPISNYLSYQQ